MISEIKGNTPMEEKLELQRLALVIERLAEKIGELNEQTSEKIDQLHDKIEKQAILIGQLEGKLQAAIEFQQQIRTLGTTGKVGLYVIGALVALAVGVTTLIKNWR